MRHALVDLDVSPLIVRASEWPARLSGLDSAGLYSWWVDQAGAEDLGRGLEQDVPAGRIYAGQAGATRWPSGTPSAATLRTRITTQHLGGNIYGSTFRLTIAAALAGALGLVALDRKRLSLGGEQALSKWILASAWPCTRVLPVTLYLTTSKVGESPTEPELGNATRHYAAEGNHRVPLLGATSRCVWAHDLLPISRKVQLPRAPSIRAAHGLAPSLRDRRRLSRTTQ